MDNDTKVRAHIEPHADGQGATVLLVIGETAYALEATEELASLRAYRSLADGTTPRVAEAHLELVADEDDREDFADVLPFRPTTIAPPALTAVPCVLLLPSEAA